MTKKENIFLFVCSEAVESKLVKLETDRTVILCPNGECSLAQPHMVFRILPMGLIAPRLSNKGSFRLVTI